MIYIYNFHVLNHLLLIYTRKLHWNRIAITASRVADGHDIRLANVSIVLVSIDENVSYESSPLALFLFS